MRKYEKGNGVLIRIDRFSYFFELLGLSGFPKFAIEIPKFFPTFKNLGESWENWVSEGRSFHKEKELQRQM